MDPATEAATDPRVPLAAERTLLAWVRTGLAMMGFGFVVARFGMFLREMAATYPAEEELATRRGQFSLLFGVLLVLLGVTINVTGAIRHARYLRKLREGRPPSTSGMAEMILCGTLAAIGIAMAVYLVIVR